MASDLQEHPDGDVVAAPVLPVYAPDGTCVTDFGPDPVVAAGRAPRTSEQRQVEAIASCPPGPVLDAWLRELDQRVVSPTVLVEVVAAIDRMESHLHARKLAAVAELASRQEMRPDWSPLAGAPPTQSCVAGDELAMRLGWARMTASRVVRRAVVLDGLLGATGEALEAGHVDAAKAEVLAAALTDQSFQVAHAVEDAVLPDADQCSVAELRQRVQREIRLADPDGAANRHERARCTRRVTHPRPQADGMASMWLVLAAEDATRVDGVLDHAARAAKAVGDGRTLDQLRADGLRDLVVGDVPVSDGPAFEVRLDPPAPAVPKPRRSAEDLSVTTFSLTPRPPVDPIPTATIVPLDSTGPDCAAGASAGAATAASPDAAPAPEASPVPEGAPTPVPGPALGPSAVPSPATGPSPVPGPALGPSAVPSPAGPSPVPVPATGGSAVPAPVPVPARLHPMLRPPRRRGPHHHQRLDPDRPGRPTGRPRRPRPHRRRPRPRPGRRRRLAARRHRPHHPPGPRRRQAAVPSAGGAGRLRATTRRDLRGARVHGPGLPLRARPHRGVPPPARRRPRRCPGPHRRGQPRTAVPPAPPAEDRRRVPAAADRARPVRVAHPDRAPVPDAAGHRAVPRRHGGPVRRAAPVLTPRTARYRPERHARAGPEPRRVVDVGGARHTGLHVWPLRADPGRGPARARPRDRPDPRRAPGTVLERRPDPGRAGGARARRGRRPAAPAPAGPVGPRAVVGQGRVDRLADDQRPLGDGARQAGVPEGGGEASRAGPNGRLLRVAGQRARPQDAVFPARHRAAGRRRPVRAVARPQQGRRRPDALAVDRHDHHAARDRQPRAHPRPLPGAAARPPVGRLAGPDDHGRRRGRGDAGERAGAAPDPTRGRPGGGQRR